MSLVSERAATMPLVSAPGPALGDRILQFTIVAMLAAQADSERTVVRKHVRNDVIHWVIIVAILVLLALASSLVVAGIILCATQGGVLEFVAQLDPWMVRVGCVRI